MEDTSKILFLSDNPILLLDNDKLLDDSYQPKLKNILHVSNDFNNYICFKISFTSSKTIIRVEESSKNNIGFELMINREKKEIIETFPFVFISGKKSFGEFLESSKLFEPVEFIKSPHFEELLKITKRDFIQNRFYSNFVQKMEAKKGKKTIYDELTLFAFSLRPNGKLPSLQQLKNMCSTFLDLIFSVNESVVNAFLIIAKEFFDLLFHSPYILVVPALSVVASNAFPGKIEEYYIDICKSYDFADDSIDLLESIVPFCKIKGLICAYHPYLDDEFVKIRESIQGFDSTKDFTEQVQKKLECIETMKLVQIPLFIDYVRPYTDFCKIEDIGNEFLLTKINDYISGKSPGELKASENIQQVMFRDMKFKEVISDGSITKD